MQNDNENIENNNDSMHDCNHISAKYSYNKNVDWEAIELDYIHGLLSVYQISTLYNVPESTIKTKVKEFGWERNLADKINAAKDQRINLKTATKESGNINPTEKEIVETVAELQSKIILSHRQDIGLARSVCMKLLVELSALTDHSEDMKLLGDVMKNPDKYGHDKQNDIYQKVISMKGRTEDMKRLSDSIVKLIELEAKTYGIKDYREEKLVDNDLIARQRREEDYNILRSKLISLNKNNDNGND